MKIVNLENPRFALPLLGGLAILFTIVHLLQWSEYNTALDWRYFQYIFEAGRTSILEHGQFPGWNPYACGGTVLHANPQSPFLSPFYPLVLMFGTVPGMKVYVLVHVLVGLFGGFYLARTLGLRGAAIYLLPVAFCTSGRFIWILHGGQFSMLTFFFLPFLLAFFLKAQKDLRWVLAAGSVMAVMLLEGGTYGVPLSGVFLGLLVLVLFFESRFSWRPFYSLAMLVGIAAVLAAPKLIPMLDYLIAHPRRVPPVDDALGLVELARMFFERLTGEYMLDRGRDPATRFVYSWWGEYGAYLSYGLWPLILIGFARRFRDSLKWLVLALVFVLFTAGQHGWASPFELLRLLPLYQDLRAPSRFSMLVVLAVSVAACYGLMVVSAWVSKSHKRWLGALPWVLLVAVAADQTIYSGQVLSTVDHDQLQKVEPEPVFVTQLASNLRLEAYARKNQGTLGCYEPLFERHGYRSPAYHRLARMGAEAELQAPGPAKVSVLERSPNRIDLAVESDREVVVHLRSNYNEQWRSDVGEVFSAGGVLALRLPAGNQHVKLWYSSSLVVAGSLIALLGMLVLIGLAIVWRFRHPPDPG